MLPAIEVPVDGVIRGRFLGIYEHENSQTNETFHSVSLGIGPNLVGKINPNSTVAKQLMDNSEKLVGQMFEISGVRAVTVETDDDNETPIMDKRGSKMCRIRATEPDALYGATPTPLKLRLLPKTEKATEATDASQLDLSSLNAG